jgi:hypothetical protein
LFLHEQEQEKYATDVAMAINQDVVDRDFALARQLQEQTEAPTFVPHSSHRPVPNRRPVPHRIPPGFPDIDHMTYDEVLEWEEAAGKVVVALSEEERHALPTRIFTSESSQDTACCICMCDYEQGDEVATLKCFHSFHKQCILKWLQSHVTCPVDMQDVRHEHSADTDHGR